MSTEFLKRDEAALIFGRARPLIDVTLRREFRLPKVDARQVEDEVHLWFARFVMRSGSRPRVESERTSLFWATCQAARQYWHWKLDGAPVADQRLKQALSRDPHEMAKELEQKLCEREKRQSRLKAEEMPS